jgi:hypothetical protein
MSDLDNKFITLREYIDTLFRERDKQYEQRFKAQQEALGIALAAKNVTAALAISLIVGVMGLLGAVVALWRH